MSNEPDRLTAIRAKHQKLMDMGNQTYPDGTPMFIVSPLRKEIDFLLKVIHLLEEQVQAQILANLEVSTEYTQPPAPGPLTRAAARLDNWIARKVNP